MCEIIGKYVGRKKTLQGYKFALRDKKTGKIFSSATGIEYEVGMVKIPKHQIAFGLYWSTQLLNPKSVSYNRNYIGKTGIYECYQDAFNMGVSFNSEVNFSMLKETNCEPVVVKMTFSGAKTHIGHYGGDVVLLSDEILNMKVVRPVRKINYDLYWR